MKFENKYDLRGIPHELLGLPILEREEEKTLFAELDRIREKILGVDRDSWFLEENWTRIEQMSSVKNADLDFKQIREIRDRVIEGCTRFVYFTVKNMGVSKSIPFIEQFQEGMLGVAEAVFRYDTRMATRFQSFAGWVIRTYVRQYRLTNSEFMKTPSRVAEIRRFLYHYKGDVHAPEDIKKSMDSKYSFTTPLISIEQALLSYYSTSEIQFENSSVSIFEHIPSEDECTDDVIDRNRLYSTVYKFLSELNPSQIRVISDKYGLNTGSEKSNIDIGQEMGISRERVRQIEGKALELLRNKINCLHQRPVSCKIEPEGDENDGILRRYSDRADRWGISGRRIPGLLGV